MSDKTKIYVFNSGSEFANLHVGVALCQDGIAIASHASSDETWMKHDMGLTSDWKHNAYNEHCGEGCWELEWVPTDQIDNHAGLTAAIELNKTLDRPAEI